MSSVGDEAFAIVCLDNSLDRWKEEAEDPDKKNRLNWQPIMYTVNPSESSKHGEQFVSHRCTGNAIAHN